VLHKGYSLGGSYHGHDSIFLLNFYGVRWQVEVKQTYPNVMFVVGPVWSDFMSKNITQDVKCLYFIEERISKGFVDRHELHGYASAVESHKDKKFEFKLCKKSKSVGMFSTTTLRRHACSLIHGTTRIQAWGKLVRTGVDDVLLLAPTLKHVVPSLVA
nr:hypothetical protein [Tanacetum cinerariifolium]